LPAHDLVSECPPLDLNAPYCYLLLSSHFALTSACARHDNTLVGFVSGYRIPEAPSTLFIWQVAVSAQMRGRGLGQAMIEHILHRPQNADIRELQTTVTPGNTPSEGMFRAFARRLGAKIEQSVMFDRDRDFAQRHDSEILFRIGPFAAAQSLERTSP